MIHFLLKTSLVAMAIISLTSCATLSKQDCQVADWLAIGQRDGTNGRAMDYVLQHAKACGKINITPDKAQWEQGRQQGLKLYCTSSNAYNLGIKGNTLNLVCPAKTLAILQQANNQGLALYKMQQQLKSDIRERDKLVDELQKLQNGSNLDFKTEKEARVYMLGLPDKISILNSKIRYQQQQLQSLQP